MLKIKFVITVLVLSLSFSSVVTHGKTNSKISFKKWKKVLAAKAPRTICSKKHTLRSCYPISWKSCNKEVRKYIPRCFSKLPKFTGFVALPKEGSDLGFKVGACVYKLVLAANPEIKVKRRKRCDLF